MQGKHSQVPYPKSTCGEAEKLPRYFTCGHSYFSEAYFQSKTQPLVSQVCLVVGQRGREEDRPIGRNNRYTKVFVQANFYELPRRPLDIHKTSGGQWPPIVVYNRHLSQYQALNNQYLSTTRLAKKSRPFCFP